MNLRKILFSILAFALLPALAHAAADSITVGTVTASGTTVDVPVYIRDASGTPLGIDKPAGSKIQSYSIKVNYSPASAIQSITFGRSGITSGLTPTVEFTPSGSGTVSLLDTFSESSNPIPFTLDRAAPGDKVAHLAITLSPSATPGSSISLTLDASLTQLTDQGGSAATKETSGNGFLNLINGAINVPPLSVSIAPPSRTVSLKSNANFVATISSAVSTSTTINLTSSNTSVATVPATITVPAGATSKDFVATTLALGGSTITASIPGSNATATVAVVEAPCNVPAVPQLGGPVSVDAGVSYDITWSAIADASEYVLEESTDAAFTNATSRTVTTTSASFSHSDGGTRYYYRLRARNHAGNCDVTSAVSTAISVLINVQAAPPMRVLAVVGSVQGGFGSFFKTSIQLYNPRDVAVSGRIVFHPINTAGSATDPSLAYSLAPGKSVAYADLLPAMGVASGIGSADILADATSPLPVSLVRVFNDGGTAGTTGLGEDALAPDAALQTGQTGVLIAPADVVRFRLNVGLRTLTFGAALTIAVRDGDGVVVKTVTKSYDPTFFTQTSATSILDGYVLKGGETISFTVTSGSAFVYGATTDNTTNDPSVQFAQR